MAGLSETDIAKDGFARVHIYREMLYFRCRDLLVGLSSRDLSNRASEDAS